VKNAVDNAWIRKAAAVAARFPRERLHPAVVAWAESRRVHARGPWAVAFSGGADSLALLLLLCAHWPERRARFVALHFNHRLRGAAADADERFCRRVCGALGVRLYVGRWNQRLAGAKHTKRGLAGCGRELVAGVADPGLPVVALAKAGPASARPATVSRSIRRASEEEARMARFAFFERAMRRAGARALWLGHQQDDIAETMLMRLARGSGTGGLAAPRPVQRVGDQVRLRPLLTVKKQEVTRGLRECGVRWREDRTNAGTAYFRNRIRHQVLPAWQEAAGRDAVSGAALARERLEEDDAALEAWLEELRPWGRGGTLDLAVLKGRPRALVRRALHRWLSAQPLAGELSRPGFEDLLAAAIACKGTRRSLGRDGFAVVRGGKLRFERAADSRTTRWRSRPQKQLSTGGNGGSGGLKAEG
jgi:tRNA(Ile)-lysidine synthase